MRSCGTWWITLAVLVAAGCEGPKAPRTYSAGGKVIYADGEVLTGGAVQFRPQSDTSPSAVAEVGKDGKFTLSTIVNGNKIAGAVEGSFHVTFVPPVGADQTGRPVVLPDVYTVKPRGANDFTLTVPRPR